MPKIQLVSLVALLVATGANGLRAEPIRYTCEVWHPRLGQNPDATFVIDPVMKKCNGQPCFVSDGEFKWQEQNGKYEFTINRLSREGTYMNLGELLFSYVGAGVDPLLFAGEVAVS